MIQIKLECIFKGSNKLLDGRLRPGGYVNVQVQGPVQGYVSGQVQRQVNGQVQVQGWLYGLDQVQGKVKFINLSVQLTTVRIGKLLTSKVVGTNVGLEPAPVTLTASMRNFALDSAVQPGLATMKIALRVPLHF